MRSYFITEEQFVQASLRAFAQARRKLLIALFVVPLLLVPWLGEADRRWAELGVLYLVLVVFAFGISPLVNRWWFRRVYRRNPLLHREQTFEFTPDGLRLCSENGESRYRFAELQDVRVFPEMVLVYPLTTLFHMLPRELLTDEELELLRRCGKS